MKKNILKDKFLDKMRLTGDVKADKIAEIIWKNPDCNIMEDLKNLSISNLTHIKDSVFELDTMKYHTEEEKKAIVAYFENTSLDEKHINEKTKSYFQLNEFLFNRYGYFITCILFFKSLPTGYMCPKPARVLNETKLLKTFAARRVMETAQFIFAVNNASWYKEGNKGIIAIRKVRLLHAGMRKAIMSKGHNGKKWDTKKMGVPINQEDLALTNYLFSIAILDGLDSMGIHYTNKEREALYMTWQYIGQMMGISEKLFVDNIDDARKHYEKILQRNISIDNPAGAALTDALLESMNEITGQDIKKNTLEHVTMYLLNDKRCWQSLGLHKPGIVDNIWMSTLHFILSWRLWQRLFHKTKNNRFMNFVNSNARNVLAKMFGLGPLMAKNPNKNPLEIFSLVVLKKLQQRDRITWNKMTPIQRDNTFFQENELFKNWHLDQIDLES